MSQPPTQNPISFTEWLSGRISDWLGSPDCAAAGAMLGKVSVDDILAKAEDNTLPPLTRLVYAYVAWLFGASESSLRQVVSTIENDIPESNDVPMLQIKGCALTGSPCLPQHAAEAIYVLLRYGYRFDHRSVIDCVYHKIWFELDGNCVPHVISYGPRWDIEVGSDIGFTTSLVRVAVEKNDREYALKALDNGLWLWQWLNDNLWSGDHYWYAVNWHDYTWGIDTFIGVMALHYWSLKLRNEGVPYLDRVRSHLWNAVLSDGISSRQWCCGSYALTHHVPDNPACGSRAMHVSVFTLHASVPTFDGAAYNSYVNIVKGQYWRNIVNSDCWDSSRGLLKCLNTDNAGSEPCTCHLIQAMPHYMVYYPAGETVVPVSWRHFHPALNTAMAMRLVTEGGYRLYLPSGPNGIYYYDGGDFKYYRPTRMGLIEITYDENGNVTNIREAGDLPSRPEYIGFIVYEPSRIPTRLTLRVEVL